MRDAEWIDPAGGVTDVYKTILVNKHEDGPYKGLSAKEVLRRLGDGRIEPPLADAHPKFWVTDCECGALDLKCCKCPCRFTELRTKLHGKLEACTFLPQSEVIEAIEDWEIWFAHWASMSAVEEKYERPVWAFPRVPAQEAKDQEASNKEPDRSAELAAVAKVQVSHQLNRTGRKNAVKAAKAAHAEAKQSSCLVVHSPPIAPKTLVVVVAPDPDASHSDSSSGAEEEPMPFYVAHTLQCTQPAKGAKFKVKVQWWSYYGKSATKFQGPYQIQKTKNRDWDEIEQHSIIWSEDKSMNDRHYNKRLRKLFYSHDSKHTGRVIQAKVCATLAVHDDVHSAYFAYKTGQEKCKKRQCR